MSFLDEKFIPIYESLDGERTEDIAFYLILAAAAKGRVLDAGCGSGRILLPALEQGITIEGFDYSKPMLEELHKKAAQKSLKPNIKQKDLADFRAPANRYSLIFCAFNTFLHIMTQEEQLKVLSQFYRSLQPGGLLAFDIINPINFDILNNEAKSFEGSITTNESGEKIHIWRWFDHDALLQQAVYHREFEIHSPKGKTKKGAKTTNSKTKKTSYPSDISFRWTYPSEIRLLLQLAGFTDFKVYGDFEFGDLREDSSQQVWIARKGKQHKTKNK